MIPNTCFQVQLARECVYEGVPSFFFFFTVLDGANFDKLQKISLSGTIAASNEEERRKKRRGQKKRREEQFTYDVGRTRRLGVKKMRCSPVQTQKWKLK